MQQQPNTIESFAAMCGSSVTDAAAFVECVSLWVNKGYSIEEAIKRHMGTLEKLLVNVHYGLRNPLSPYRPHATALRSHLSSEIWSDLNEVTA